MRIQPETALTLLHACPYGTLATHSTQLPGFPYATVLPFVPDPQHRPLLCVSALAEHTKNLLADPRVSLSLVQPDADDVHNCPRLTLVATAERIVPEPSLLARYLRYQPDTEALLTLDFMFFRLQPVRLRYIGGVGRLGWLAEQDWNDLPKLSTAREEDFLRTASKQANPAIRLLGADCFGIDYEVHGKRRRKSFVEVVTAETFDTRALGVVAELG